MGQNLNSCRGVVETMVESNIPQQRKIKVIKQTRGFCSVACVRMIAGVYGIDLSESETIDGLGTDRDLGCSPENIVRFAQEKLHFDAGFREGSSLDELKALHSRDVYPIVNFFSHFGEGHYSVVTHVNGDYMTYIDPKLGRRVRRHKQDFYTSWFDYRGEFPPMDKQDYITRGRIVMAPKGIIPSSFLD